MLVPRYASALSRAIGSCRGGIVESLRLVMVSGSPYVPATGGAYKANRLIGEQLAARGHSVRVVASARTGLHHGATLAQFREELTARHIAATVEGFDHRFELNGVEVHAVDGLLHLPKVAAAQIRGFDPDWIMVSSEDWRQTLLAAALQAAPTKVVYLAHTLPSLPFGPRSAEPFAPGAALVARTRAIVAPSKDLARYMVEFGGGTPQVEVVYPPVYGAPPFSELGRFDNPFVTMINPCPLKGLEIFVALVEALPDVRFAAVPSWGTSSADRERLEALGVTLLPPSERIDDFLAQTRVLVNPTLTQVGLPLTVIEAMLRGIPVLASDIGGLREIGLAGRLALPVRPIESYAMRAGVPIADAPPPQECGPWIDALKRLVSDREHYAVEAEAARASAIGFVTRTGVEAYEQLLASLS
jgi:glycosyltransferase involved in cell wall biosynthesis